MAKLAPKDKRLAGTRGSEEQAVEGGPFLGWLGSLTKEQGVKFIMAFLVVLVLSWWLLPWWLAVLVTLAVMHDLL